MAGQYRTGVQVELGAPLSPLHQGFRLRTLTVEINGTSHQRKWGTHFFELPPGRHTVEVYMRNLLLGSKEATASTVVTVEEQKVARIKSSPPTALWHGTSGRFQIEPSEPAGRVPMTGVPAGAPAAPEPATVRDWWTRDWPATPSPSGSTGAPPAGASPAPAAAGATCTNCGASLGPAARFCHECGAPAPAPRACPACGHVQPSGKFCSNCGAEIPSAEAASRAETKVSRSRRQRVAKEHAPAPVEAEAEIAPSKASATKEEAAARRRRRRTEEAPA